jgi:hypothetical protein
VADALHTPGVVSAQDGRLDDAGLIACHGAGMDVRTGVMHGPGTTALITGTADTAPMAVLVAAHHAVARRQVSEGVYRGATEAPVRVPIDAAPASGSRIDVVWVKQADASAGVLNPDATTEWLVSKTTGTAGTSPTKPAIPVGALELGTVTVAAGATATNGAGVTITNTVRQTVARGARVPVRSQAERDALTAFPGLEVYRLDNGTIQVRNAANSAWLTTFDPAAKQRGVELRRTVSASISAGTLTWLSFVAGEQSNDTDGIFAEPGADRPLTVPAGMGGAWDASWYTVLDTPSSAAAARHFSELVTLSGTTERVWRVTGWGEGLTSGATELRLAAGDKVGFRLFQATGAARNLTDRGLILRYRGA